MRDQFDGKFRLRSTPCAFPRVPRAQPSGFSAGTTTISVPAGAPAATQPPRDREARRLAAVDAADDEHAVRRRRAAEHDGPDRAAVDAVADRKHGKESGKESHVPVIR